ncbi:Dephospho-CoA kinase cab5 [Saitoella coloradoensis]
MLIIGLTGGIATGKSTVSSLLSSPPNPLPILDADLIAREVVLPGTSAYRAIVSHFSPTVPDLLEDDGTLNRAALGRAVFGESEDAKRERKVLNGVTHPAVKRALVWGVLKAWLRGEWAVVLDVPLLFEGGLDKFCGMTLLVACDGKAQRERLLKRNPHLSEEEADQRIASQLSLEDKRRRADIVIENDGSLEDLERSVRDVVDGLKPWGLVTLMEWLIPGFGLWMAGKEWFVRNYWRGERKAKL